jgi:hypothetical protein
MTSGSNEAWISRYVRIEPPDARVLAAPGSWK